VAGFVDQLLTLPAWVVLLVTGALVFVEDALFVGFVLPAETAAVLAGVAANRGNVSLAAVIIVVVVCAVVGDTVGYEVGRHLGQRVLAWSKLDPYRERLDGAQRFLARRGGGAVFFGRFIAFFRAVMPALAGTSRMHYPKFLFWNASGGILWGTGVVLLGYLAGESYAKVEKTLGRGTALAALVVVVLGYLAWHLHRRRTERAERAEKTG
jgi:membrane protein DedA with SNARE-associated domain